MDDKQYTQEEIFELLNIPGKVVVKDACHGKKPKLNKEEREILEITARPDFMDMLREEFKNNPIDYEQAQAELESSMLNEAQQQLRELNETQTW